jgi:DNA primase
VRGGSAGETTLEEFKARLPLAEVVARYVRLTKAGREHRGLCPFHKEKTPSFHVVAEKGFYHCFGCGAHGTAIDFVMGVEGLDFGGAVERLAEMTGLPAPRRRGAEAAAQEAEANARLYAANAAAAAWFARQLDEGRGGPGGGAGAEARAYLERRQVDRDLARTFGLGYAPDDGQALRRAMQDQGFAEAELVAAGLLAAPEDGSGRAAYDRFRHRVVFPIADERGRVVGFGGRALGEARAKYLNTPETALFRKGELLYNFHRAAPAARERREIVLAEGYMDVIALARAGIPNATAPLGTAVTEPQLRLLWRHADAPLVCLDGDRAGLAAALRAAERALPLMPAGKSLRFALLPEGEDPDSYVARHGAAAMGEVLGRAHSLSQLVWRLETQAGAARFDTPEAQAGLRRRLREFAKLAADHDLRASLESGFQELVDAAFPRRPRWRGGQDRQRPWAGGQAGPGGQGAASDGGRFGRTRGGWEGEGPSRLAAGLGDPAWSSEARLLAPAILNPQLLEGHEEAFAALELASGDLESLRQEILLWFGDGPALDATALAQHLHRHGLAGVRERVLATVARALKRRGETTAWLEPGEWEAMLARWRQSSALRHQQASFSESVIGGEASEVAVNRTGLDRLLNRRPEDEPAGVPSADSGPDLGES